MNLPMINQVRALWELCFDDSEAFTDLYFRLRYTDDVNIALTEGGEVVSALQMLPYPMTFGNSRIDTAYVSGACTHPAHRGRGLMRRLLARAFEQMRSKGVAVSTLIPAEPWLFGYYAGVGYAPVFRRTTQVFTASASTPLPPGTTFEAAETNPDEAYRYLCRRLQERPCSILHTEADFQVILADLSLGGGHLFTLRRDGRITALAVAYPQNADASAAGTRAWRIEQVEADTAADRANLLQHACEALHVAALDVALPTSHAGEGTPLGMARIINAPDVLSLHAAAHPDLHADFFLTDEQLPANTARYTLQDGRCTQKKSAGQSVIDCPALTVGELTERLFGTLCPYMSLMLN